MRYRYGYVKRKDSPRLTPKSAFLRKLERMQRKPNPDRIAETVFVLRRRERK